VYTSTQHTFLWRLNNHFVKIQQAKWEPIQATVFQECALMETVNLRSERYFFFINLVITSHISLELANTAWPKLGTFVICQCFGCQPLGYFHSVVVFMRSTNTTVRTRGVQNSYGHQTQKLLTYNHKAMAGRTKLWG